MPYADIWLANQTVKQKLLQADIVIQFGSRFISKRINQFLAEFQGEFWVVEQSQNAVDPNHHTQTRFNAKAHHWLRTPAIASKALVARTSGTFKILCNLYRTTSRWQS